MANFKARARALDLLGKQQIAGIPTAINELFKNAHDAYADNVEVDYFRKNKLFILRDNGLGMTKEDFEIRWLTLGTESKFANKKISAPPIDPDKPERPIMGEKGIGRLAISSIGKQTLILTKAKRGNILHDLVIAFINWSIFELPGLNLEDIIIPIRTIAQGQLPDSIIINEMKTELIDSIKKLIKDDDISEQSGNQIINEISSFIVDPAEIERKLPGLISLYGIGYGTHFYISPTDDSLNSDIDGEPDSKNATKIEKMLVGFTNTMTLNHPKPQIEVAFRDYRGNDERYYSILGKEEFFTPEDFEIADHHFQGRFDEFGQFSGTIKVYNEKSFSHKINWAGNNYKLTDCGPFSINIAYIQGALRQSILTAEDHARLCAKGDKYGGVYIYKDNIRILPYGNSDYDFIDIEKNRTKSASYYFFSYRRMFGVINISKQANSELKEKAGREGFIENKAYRQVREILKNFFVQLAADFFREASGGPKTDFWLGKRKEREKYYKAIEKREQQSKIRKDKFINELNVFFERTRNTTIKVPFDNLLEETEAKFSSLAHIEDVDVSGQQLIEYESQARRKLEGLKLSLNITLPRGIALSKDTKQDWEAYLSEFENLNGSVFIPTADRIEELVNDYKNRLHLEISKRKRLELAVEQISEEAKKVTSKKEKEAKEAASIVSSKVKELTNELMSELEDKIREIKDQFKTLKIDEVADFDLVSERKRMENEIDIEKSKSTQILESIIKQLEGIYWERNQEGNIITNEEIYRSLEEEVYELKDRLHADVELSQLGLAVGVIQHEFNSTIKSIRSSIKELKVWADVNEQMDGVYKNIRTNFEHLDGYLTLFTPLNRRLYREKEEFSAIEIKYFLSDLFKTRMERHNIQLKHTKGFSKRKIMGYKSTFYPVFVNIVDNAIHWVNQKNDEGEKIIILHSDEEAFYISNNGPSIDIKDFERIFDLGFSRKPNGRGLGLHISREVMNSVNYQIELDTPREGYAVTFKISPQNYKDE